MKYSKQNSEVFNLDNAISFLFGKGCNVSKICNFHTCGTIEVNGVCYDWFMNVNEFKFIEA